MKRLFLSLFLSLILFCGSANAADQNIYISSSAAAGGDGSIGTPYDAFSDINWSAGGANSITDWVTASDDVFINLKRGDIFSSAQLTIGMAAASGVSGHPITIQDYGTGDIPLIDTSGATQYAIYISSRDYITIKNIKCNNGSLYNIRSHVASYIILQDIHSTSGDYGVYVSGAGSNTSIIRPVLENARIYLHSDTSTVTIDTPTITGSMANGIYVASVDNVTITNPDISLNDLGNGISVVNNTEGPVMITGGTVQHTLYGLYLTGCSCNVTVSETIFSNNASRGIYTTSNTSTMLLSGVQSKDNDGSGLYFVDTANATIKNQSIISDNHNSGITFTGASSINNEIIDSLVYNNGVDGINFTAGASDSLVARNKVYNNGQRDVISHGDGITAHVDNTGLTIRHNLIYGNRNAGLAMVNNSQGVAYNNVIYNNGDSESVNMGVRGGYYCASTAGASWTLRNNIFQGNYPYEIHTTAVGWSDTDIDYNHYYHPADSNFADIGAGIINWTTYSTNEAHSAYSDPRLRNATADFYLRSTSPCIDAGVDVSLVYDYNGYRIPNGSAPDIGAYEHYRKTYGSMHRSVCKKTSDAVLKVEESGLVNLDSTTGNIAIYLPPLSLSWGTPFFLHRDNAGVNTITIYANESGETIGGAANKTLVTQYDTLLVWGGTDQWYCQPYTQ